MTGERESPRGSADGIGTSEPDDAEGRTGHAGPGPARLLVGARLRRLREAAGVTCEEAGRAIRGSHSKISRMELGRTGFKARDLTDLLTLYGVTGEAEREDLLALARQANGPAWWQEYADAVPAWFGHYLGLERAAALVRCYESRFVPCLLQTRDYARAVIASHHFLDPPERITQRLDLQTARQAMLQRPNAARLWAIIDEAALRRRFGGTATTRAQLEHLIEMAGRPNITVQVIPFAAGGHAAVGGPVTILRFAEWEIPDLVYLDQGTGALYPDRQADLVHYRMLMDRLAVEAEPAEATVAILRRILAET